jgi:hypothetical protein
MELTMVFRSTLTIFNPSIAIARISQPVWAGLIRPGMSLLTLKRLMYDLSSMAFVLMWIIIRWSGTILESLTASWRGISQPPELLRPIVALSTRSCSRRALWS